MSGEQPAVKVMWKTHEVTASVASVEVEDNDRLIDKATVVLKDPHVSAPDLAPGDPITVTLGWSSKSAVLFEGQVVSTPGQAPASGVPTLSVVAYDLSYLMHQRPVDATPQGRLSQIVAQIAGAYPAITVDQKNIVCDPDPNFTGDPALRQHGQTDLQFLQWLAWRYGHRVFVEYNDDKSQFYFMSNHRLATAKPLGALQWCHGLRQLQEFRYERVASRAIRQKVAAIPNPQDGTASPVNGPTPPPVQPVEPNAQHAATLARIDPAEAARYTSGADASPPATPTPAAVIGLPSDPRLAEAVTTWDPTAVLGLRGTGTAVGNIMLRAKGKVTIEGIAPWAEGDWYVSKATHTWHDTTIGKTRSATYQTQFTVTR
jgi:hypothetical protein